MLIRTMESVREGRPDTSRHDYRNPALVMIDGVLTSCCTLCGTRFDDELTTENWYKFIRSEYCDSCREKVRLEQARQRQRNYRKSKKQLKKDYAVQNSLLKQENELLRDMVMLLRSDVEKLRNE